MFECDCVHVSHEYISVCECDIFVFAQQTDVEDISHACTHLVECIRAAA